MRTITLPLTALLVLALASPAQAGLITGRAEYDAGTGLHTYIYALDNNGPWAVTQLSVLVAPNRVEYDLRPQAWSAPPGWEFGTSVSGGIAQEPYNEVGTFWFWYNPDGLPVGGRAEFSFTSGYGPGVAGNNYFVYAPAAERDGQDGIVEYGQTVAPVVAPEPATVTLCGCALGLLGVARQFLRSGRRDRP